MEATRSPARQVGLLESTSDRSLWIAWHLFSAICLPLASSQLRLQSSFGDLLRSEPVFLAGLAVAHLLVASVLTWRGLRRRSIPLYEVLALVVVAYGLLYVVLQQTHVVYYRSILTIATAGSFVLASLSLELRPRIYKVLLPALIVATGALVTSGMSGGVTGTSTADSVFYRLKLQVFANLAPSDMPEAGAIKVFGDGLLAGVGDGGLFYITEDRATKQLVSRRLTYQVPLSWRTLTSAVGPLSNFQDGKYRVTDILIQSAGDHFRLFAAHNYWRREADCTGLAVSAIEGSRSAFLEGRAGLAWKTVYETKPCLPLKNGVAYLLDGGRLLELDHDTLLLSVGDFAQTGWDGRTWNPKRDLPQDPRADYGKTLLIDVNTGSSEVYSLGHRNPEGLHRTPDGRIWLAEHGMRGGDELNLIVQGGNYGWPLVTLGTDYNFTTWPMQTLPGYHAGFARPATAWLPSVGISAVTSVQKDHFALWKGDLLVGSLAKHSLFRVRTSGNRVVFTERVYRDVGGRIRDLTETQDGRIALLLAGGSVALLDTVEAPAVAGGAAQQSAGPPREGEAAFTRCQDCHPIVDGITHGAGPDLKGIVGRTIASAPGFDYSPALRALSGTWTRQRLDAFVRDPAAFAPGTAMPGDGIQDADVRRQLIDYLSTRN